MNGEFTSEVGDKILAQVLNEGKEALLKASQYLEEADFDSTEQNIIFGVVSSLLSKGKEVNFVSTYQYISSRSNGLDQHLKKLTVTGDTEKALAGLLDRLTEISRIQLEPSNHLETNCLILKEQSLKRKEIERRKREIQELETGADVFGVMEHAQAESVKVLSDLEHIKSFSTLGDAVEEALREMEKEQRGEIVRLGTGFSDLDKVIGGLEKGSLYVLGAEQKYGKSFLVGQIALHVAKQNIPVGIISLEMRAKRLAKRYFSQYAGSEAVQASQFERLQEACTQLRDLPLFIYDTSLSLRKLVAVVHQFAFEKKVQLLVVDYLHLIEGDRKANTSRTEEVGGVVKVLKNLATDLNLPVLLVASLTVKSMAQRTERKPKSTDFRDSGEIPYHADCILFLWKPDDENPNYRELFIGDIRDGASGEPIGLYFDENSLTFRQVARRSPPPLRYEYPDKDYFVKG